MKYNKENFKIVCEIMYNFTNNSVYFGFTPNLLHFYSLLDEIRNFIKSGEVCKYPLINLATKQAIPFKINSVKIF